MENERKIAVKVENLKKVFKKRSGLFGSVISCEWALKGITLNIYDKETYGVLGPNGSGKSTLIRILSTLLIPDGGKVEILGRKLPKDETWIRRNIGRVSVDAAFYKKLSARENLLYAAQLYGIPASEADHNAKEILGKLGMQARRYNDPLEEMSRGMQQKVAITRALLVNPPVLLLDEPTTGLDPKSKREVQDYLEQIRKDFGTTILLTTHDMNEAEKLCDRIGFIANGNLVAEGTADDLKRKADKPDLEEAFIALSGIGLEEKEEED